MNFIIDSSSWSQSFYPPYSEVSKVLEHAKCEDVESVYSNAENIDQVMFQNLASNEGSIRFLKIENVHTELQRERAAHDKDIDGLSKQVHNKVHQISEMQKSRPKKLLVELKSAKEISLVPRCCITNSEGCIRSNRHSPKFAGPSQPVTSGLASSNHITLSRLPQPCGDSDPAEELPVSPVSKFSRSTGKIFPRRIKLPTLVFAGWDKLAPYKTPKTCKKQPPSDGFSGVVMKYLPSHGINSHSRMGWTPKTSNDSKPSIWSAKAQDRINAVKYGNHLGAVQTPNPQRLSKQHPIAFSPMATYTPFPRHSELQTPRTFADYQLDTNLDIVGLLSQCPQLQQIVNAQERKAAQISRAL
jgi:hypothetical protein